MKIGQRDKFSKNNKGFSFVELIVVVAIMGVVAGMAVLGLSSIAGWKATKCAKEIEAQFIDTKTTALSKDSAELKLYYVDSQGYYIDKGTFAYTVSKDPATGVYSKVLSATGDVSTSKISDVGIVIYASFATKDGTSVISDVEIENAGSYKSIQVGFDRASGAMMPVRINGAATDFTDATGNPYYLKTLKIYQGSQSTNVEFVPVTGKFYVD